MGTGRATSFTLPLHVSSGDWNRVSTSLHSTRKMTVWTRAGSEWTHQLQTQETWLSRPCPHPDKPVRDLAVPPRWHQYNAHVDSPWPCPFHPRLSSLHDPSQVPTWKTPSLHPSTSAGPSAWPWLVPAQETPRQFPLVPVAPVERAQPIVPLGAPWTAPFWHRSPSQHGPSWQTHKRPTAEALGVLDPENTPLMLTWPSSSQNHQALTVYPGDLPH